MKKSRKLRGSGAQAGKGERRNLRLRLAESPIRPLAGNVGHLAKRSNAVSVCARTSRRALHTGPVGFVALLAKVTYIACGRGAQSLIALSRIFDSAPLPQTPYEVLSKRDFFNRLLVPNLLELIRQQNRVDALLGI